MRFDFSQIDDVQSFVTIPEGQYLCRIAEVREGLARDGSVRWSLRLEVAEGELAGRTAGWDNLTWSERGTPRVKSAFEAFGLDVSGVLELAARDLVGTLVTAQLELEEWEDAGGNRRPRLRVPYLGYAPAEGRPVEGALDLGTTNGAVREPDGGPGG